MLLPILFSLNLAESELAFAAMDRAVCRQHFESRVLPELLKALPQIRPKSKIEAWKSVERELRTEWQPTGAPTRRLGFQFSRKGTIGKIEVELSARYLDAAPASADVSVGFMMSGRWVGPNWQKSFLASLGVAKPFVAPYGSEDHKPFPKVEFLGRTWRLWTGPLSSSVANGVSSVQEAQFVARTPIPNP